MAIKPCASERIFTGCWHLLLLVIHAQEIKRHHTKTGKFLSFGAAVWHLDATINDFRGTDAYLKRGLREATRRIHGLASRETGRVAVPLASKSMESTAVQ